MDRMIIFGTFEFLGFHFCKKLLEKGYSVKGIHFDRLQNQWVEEKKLEIGRNANFEEQTIEALIETDRAPSTIILPLYDLYMSCNEKLLADRNSGGRILDFLRENKDGSQVVYLLPIHLLADSHRPEGLKEVEDFFCQAKELAGTGQFFYFPTIFGAWQPPSFLFHRAILNSDKNNIQVREWLGDAIFIDDLLNPMIHIIETGKMGHFLLESGMEGSWKKCADYLKLDQTDQTKEIPKIASEQMERITLKKLTPSNEALSIQKNHLFRLLY